MQRLCLAAITILVSLGALYRLQKTGEVRPPEIRLRFAKCFRSA